MFASKSARVKELEEQLAKAEQVIENQQKHNQAMETAFKKCCTLYDVSKSGRVLTLLFQRNGEPFELEVFAEMGTTVDAIKEKAGLK